MINQKMLTVLTILFLLFTTHSPKPPDISSLDPPNQKANSNKSKSPIDNIDLFLPKWTYNTNNSPFHLSKDLQRVYPNLQNGSNAKRLYILSNDLIEKLEKKREQQRLSEIIQKEINLDMTKINKNIPIYVYPEIKKAITSSLPPLVSHPSQIKEYSEIKDLVTFEPESITLKEKPTCIPTMALLNFKNTSKNKILIKNVRTDLYQATIFLFQQNNDKSQYFNPKINYPRDLDVNTFLTFQIIFLPDIIGEISGNLYIEYETDDKIGVIIYPISIQSIENIYKVKPLYYPSWQISKLLSLPITIYNPHENPLTVKEVINSFSSINLVWPNGTPVNNRGTGVPTSMVTITKSQSKNLMYINYYKEVGGVEYGLIQLKTDKDTLIIPVLVRVDSIFLKVYPSVLNFGLVHKRWDEPFLEGNNEIRAIPITVNNIAKVEMTVKGIFFKYEDKAIDFLFQFDEDDDKYCTEGENCSVEPGKKMHLGYITFNPSKINIDGLKDEIVQRNGTLFIETNTHENQFIEINYVYYIDPIFNLGEISYRIYPDFSVDPYFVGDINCTSPYNYGYVYKNIEVNHTTLEDNVVMRFKEMENKSISYDIHITNKTNFLLDLNSKYYYIPIFLNDFYYAIFPINVYDQMVDLSVCNDHNVNYERCLLLNGFTKYKSVNYLEDADTIMLEYNNHTVGQEMNLTFFLDNDNNEPVDFRFNKPWISIKTQNVYVIANGTKINDTILTMEPYTKFIFTICYTPLVKGNQTHMIPITFDSMKTIYITIKYYALMGKITFHPDKVYVNVSSPRVEDISISSSYEDEVAVTSISYGNDNVYFTTNHTNQIILNNSKSVFVGRMEMNPFIFYPLPKINYFKNSYLTYRELYQWKYIQEYNEKVELEYTKNFEVKSDLFKAELPIISNMSFLDIIPKNYSIDFGDVQIGKSVERFFTLTNPTNEVIVVQPLLANKNYIEKDIKFSEKKRKIKNYKDIENELSIFNCYFHNSTKSDNIFGNYLTMQFEEFINDLKKKNTYESTTGYDLSNAIVINKNISISEYADKKNKLNEKEILDLIYQNSIERRKETFSISDRLLCKLEHVSKEDILMKDNKELLEMVFTSEINKEILSIKKLTERKYIYRKDEALTRTKKQKGFFTFIYDLIFSHNPKENIKQVSNSNNEQDLYLSSDKSSEWNNIYYIQPNSSITLGPLIYNPNNFSNINTVLLIKNNLTLITPIKLYGNAGSGIPKFYTPSNESIQDEFVIKIDTLVDVITKDILITNIGNFPLTFDSISFSNNKCIKDSFRIVSCHSITIEPNSTKSIQIEIKPNLHFHSQTEEIFFHTKSIDNISLKVTLQIDKSLPYHLESFFDFTFDSFKLISLAFLSMLSIFIISVITKEKYESKQKDIVHSFSIFEGKEHIKTQLNNERMFIKAYRHFNNIFYEEVLVKMDEERISFIIDANRRKKIKQRDTNSKDPNTSNGEEKQNKPINNLYPTRKTKKNKKPAKKPQKNIVGITDVPQEEPKPISEQKSTSKPTSKTPLNESNAYLYQYNKYENIDNNNTTVPTNKYELNQKDIYAPSYYPRTYYNKPYQKYIKPYYPKEQSIYSTDKPLETVSDAIQYQKRPDLVEVPQPKVEEDNKMEVKKEEQNESSNNNPDMSLIENFNAFNNPMFIVPQSEESNEQNESKENEATETKPQNENIQKNIDTSIDVPVSSFNPFQYGDFFTSGVNKSINEGINNSTEKEQKLPLDDYYTSGNEDLNFNFNSLFGGVEMKPMNFDNDNEHEQIEEQPNTSKPYFESFNTNMKNKLTYSNPFATSKNHILTDLYESDDDKGEYDDLDLEANKIDEKGEGDILEEEDDEPDPEWGDEEIDVKKEGYFDETGAYKLKQP